MAGEKKEGRAAKRDVSSVVVIVLFLAILFAPGVLWILSQAGVTVPDAELHGYTDTAEAPELTVENWLDGSYQEGLAARAENSLKPRGLMIKSYNTMNLLLFNKAGRVIGKNRDIYETEYVNAELGLTAADDFSRPENLAMLDEYVAKLETLNALLKEKGKALIYYVAPSKASACRENLPDSYAGMSANPPRAVDALRERLEKTDIPFLVCADLQESLEYPAFYTTGIHWSRTYEQAVSRALISLMAEAAGKNYRNLVFEGVEESREPFDRDNDVLELSNVFWAPDITYYQYRTSMETGEGYDNIRVLIQGDSFALGLRKDLMENDPEAEVFYVTRDESAVDRNNQFEILYGDWSKMDWQRYLDHADVIALEAAEPLIKNRSFGFADALIGVLSGYEAKDTGSLPEAFDPAESGNWPAEYAGGLYDPEGTFCWTKAACSLQLDGDTLRQEGLEIELLVPGQLFGTGEAVTVSLSVNGETVRGETVRESTWVTWTVTANEWEAREDGICDVRITCSRSFVPAETDPASGDTRELALQLIYAGGFR